MSSTIVPVPSSEADEVAVATPPKPRFNALAWLTLVLCVAGLGVALYLTWVHYSHSVPVCTPGGGCEAVNSSEYSTVGGIPVALLGTGMYATLFALTLASRLTPALAPAALLARFGVALAGVGYSAYLTYISLNVLYATCIWCITSLTIVSMLCLISMWEVARPPFAGAETA